MRNMKETKLRLDWARKVLKSDNLIIITQDEGLMRIGVRPDSLDDVIALAQYRATLVDFKGNVASTIKELDNLVGDIAKDRKKKSNGKGKRIPVKKA